MIRHTNCCGGSNRLQQTKITIKGNKMANNQNQNDERPDAMPNEGKNEVEEFEPNDEAQKLGGGKGEGKGVEIGNFGDDDFVKTDQSIAQAAPGQTADFENQGGSE